MSTFVKRIKDQRGVTLIELLAVIVILGIIAAVAVPAVMSNFQDARDNADAQTESILKEATQRYILQTTLATGDVEITPGDLATAGYLVDGAVTNSAGESATITISADRKTISIDWD